LGAAHLLQLVPEYPRAGNQTATNIVLPSRLTRRSVGSSFLDEVIAWSNSLTLFTGCPSSSRAGDWCLAASCSGGSPRCLQDTQSPGLWLCQCASFLFYAQGFETGNDIEQFFVDAILTYTMKCPVEILQQLVDILFGALHRRQAARVLARKGLGTSP